MWAQPSSIHRVVAVGTWLTSLPGGSPFGGREGARQSWPGGSPAFPAISLKGWLSWPTAPPQANGCMQGEGCSDCQPAWDAYPGGPLRSIVPPESVRQRGTLQLLDRDGRLNRRQHCASSVQYCSNLDSPGTVSSGGLECGASSCTPESPKDVEHALQTLTSGCQGPSCLQVRRDPRWISSRPASSSDAATWFGHPRRGWRRLLSRPPERFRESKPGHAPPPAPGADPGGAPSRWMLSWSFQRGQQQHLALSPGMFITWKA